MKLAYARTKAGTRDVMIIGPDRYRLLRDNIYQARLIYFNPLDKKLFINRRILLNTCLFYWRCKSVKSAYLAAVIIFFAPKVVITTIDNSIHFSNVARLLHKKMRFIAVQNGVRFDMLNRPQAWHQRLFIPELACFGEHERTLFPKIGATVGAYRAVGSIREQAFREEVMQRQVSDTGGDQFNRQFNHPFNYDICIISEDFTGWDAVSPGIEAAVGTIATFAQRYADANDLSVCIALKFGLRQGVSEETSELAFYKRYMDTERVSFSVKDEGSARFASYEMSRQSHITLGMTSTLLLESASRGNKVLVCDFYGHPWTLGVSESLSLTCSPRTDDMAYEQFVAAMSSLSAESQQHFYQSRQQEIEHLIKQQNNTSVKDILNELIDGHTPDSMTRLKPRSVAETHGGQDQMKPAVEPVTVAYKST